MDLLNTTKKQMTECAPRHQLTLQAGIRMGAEAVLGVRSRSDDLDLRYLGSELGSQKGREAWGEEGLSTLHCVNLLVREGEPIDGERSALHTTRVESAGVGDRGFPTGLRGPQLWRHS